MENFQSKLLIATITFLSTLILQKPVKAQDSFPPIAYPDSAVTLLRKANSLMNEEKYGEVLDILSTVSDGDSSYLIVCYKKYLAYFKKKDFNKALEQIDNIKNENNTYGASLLTMYSSVYREQGNFEKALEVLNNGIKIYPLFAPLRYYRALVYFEQKKYDMFHDELIATIKVNPRYSAPHYHLGKINGLMNFKSKAMLALSYYIMIENTKDKVLDGIGTMEKIANNNYGKADTVVMETNKLNNYYEELDDFISSKVAIQKGYKSKVGLGYDICKQQQFLFENLKEVKDDFYQNFYVTFFKEIMDKKMFEQYIYYSYQDLQTDEINSYLKKNKNKVDDFKLWTIDYIKENHSKFTETSVGQSYKYYANNNAIKSVGVLNKEDKKIGKWTFYYENGLTSALHNYTNGELDGEVLEYYENGKLNTYATYNNGKPNGDYKIYHYATGTLREEGKLVSGKLEGVLKRYNARGVLTSTEEFKDNATNGKLEIYRAKGSLDYKTEMIGDKYLNSATYYYNNGNLLKEYKIVDGKINGPYTEFYADGKILSKGEYLKGDKTGKYIAYHYNGKIKSEGEYKNDLAEGLWKEYDANGILVEETTYSNGKINGEQIEYDFDGKKANVFEYKNGSPKNYVYYKSDGSEISKGKLSKGSKAMLTMYWSNGNKRAEGLVDELKREGNWKEYSYNGLLKKEINYLDGNFEGKYIIYFPNGRINQEFNYKNDVLNGEFKEYFSYDGKLYKEGYYVDGEIEGYVYTYYINGNIAEREFYHKGQTTGTTFNYGIKGILDRSFRFNYDNIIKADFFDTLGGKFYSIKFDSTSSGKLVFKNFNNSKSVEYDVKNSFKSGKEINYFTDGNIYSQFNTFNGEINGEYVKYYDTKAVREKGTYVNGRTHGLVSSYYHFNNTIKSEKEYVFGEGFGIDKDYYPSGKLYRSAIEINDELNGNLDNISDDGKTTFRRKYFNGICVAYGFSDNNGNFSTLTETKNETFDVKMNYANQKPFIVCSYKNGNLNGPRKVYYSNGNIYVDAVYKDGYKEGIYKEYFDNGKVFTESNYSLGLLNGIYKEYYPSGKLRFFATYYTDDLQGICEYYNELGAKTKTKYYFQDKLVWEK